ncbi:MAG TPA: hypothetical protein VMF69_11875 [Gemmataceae bacterium]|nr:hypothetical protein [Gemmataceae bacterium]
MRFFTRMIVCAAATLALCAVVFNFAASWFGAETSVLRLGRLLVFESRRSQALNARSDMVARSLEIKRGIIGRLVSGSLNMHQAIEQFQKANEVIENGDLDLIARYRLPADLEGVGRQVLAWVYNEVFSWPPEKAKSRYADLKCEFEKLFGQSPLPDER